MFNHTVNEYYGAGVLIGGLRSFLGLWLIDHSDHPSIKSFWKALDLNCHMDYLLGVPLPPLPLTSLDPYGGKVALWGGGLNEGMI